MDPRIGRSLGLEHPLEHAEGTVRDPGLGSPESIGGPLSLIGRRQGRGGRLYGLRRRGLHGGAGRRLGRIWCQQGPCSGVDGTERHGGT